MNTESAAWMHKDLKDGWLSCTNQHPETEINDWVPLYTHPAKTLTDEEIFEIAKEFMEHEYPMLGVKWVISDVNFVDFARAILRKAQEK